VIDQNYKIVSKSVHTPPSPYTSRVNNIFQKMNNNSDIESFLKTKYIKTIMKNYFLTLIVTTV
jgi:hypothetical protein